MKRFPWLILVLVLVPSALGCGGGTSVADTSAGPYDLPSGWERAALVSGLTQAACDGSALPPPPEAVEARLAGATLHVDYHHARFRCAQSVQAFARYGATQVDLLVQPVDMNPTSVTRCACTYEIGADVDASHGNVVAVYHRNDHFGGNDATPELIGTASAVAR